MASSLPPGIAAKGTVTWDVIPTDLHGNSTPYKAKQECLGVFNTLVFFSHVTFPDKSVWITIPVTAALHCGDFSVDGQTSTVMAPIYRGIQKSRKSNVSFFSDKNS